MSATVSPNQTQIFTAVGGALALFGLIPTNPALPVAIIRGQVNRVAEPAGADFVVLWPVARNRLALNIDTYADVQITGSIAGVSPSGSILTVTAVLAGNPAAGQTIYGTGVTAGCQIVRQLSGPTGGPGTYATTPTAPVASQTLYCGTISSMQETDITIQADVHGPSSADNAARIATLWRGQFGVDALAAQGQPISPLYTSDPRQLAFEDAEQQTEERWVVDLSMQANVTVTTTMQFADELKLAALTQLAAAA